MGYPMTYQRVVNRNGLAEGDYHSVPLRLAIGVNTAPPGEYMATSWPYVVERLERYEKSMALLLGDLRRLETDAVDERSICELIASRTGITTDVVAAVLKEFMAI